MSICKKLILFIASCLCFTACSKPDAGDHLFDGQKLFGDVEKYVSFGEHRTATPADSSTVDWLSRELKAYGYEINHTEFSLKQFFPKKVSVTIVESNEVFDAFPLWYVNDTIGLNPEGVLTGDVSDLTKVRDKIVLLDFSFGQSGKPASEVREKIQEFIHAGAKAIVGYKENISGEIVAFNAPIETTPWDIPIVVVSPETAKTLLANEGKHVNLSIEGTFKDVIAKNVYATIGSGSQYVVISTPVSGWFRCGGERGPGIAIWLALAQWAARQKLPYTFIFTANTGHELDFRGAHEFLEKDAPSPANTKLWIHLGAGIATLSWKDTPNGLVREDKVDAARNFFYSDSVQPAFDKAFASIAGNKWNIKERNGGELLAVVQKGYPNVLGISHAHAFFHTPNDDASKTSPEILQDAALAFRDFLIEYLK
jgi:hypothetical protein